MKKIVIMAVFSVLFICGINNSYLLGSESADNLPADKTAQIKEVSQKLGKDFANNAMDAFKSLDATQISYPEIQSRMQTYAVAMAESLLGSGLRVGIVEEVMKKSAVYYAECVDAIFVGGNLNSSIQKYVTRISELYSQQHLDIEVQSQIVSSSSYHIEQLSPLLNSFYR